MSRLYAVRLATDTIMLYFTSPEIKAFLYGGRFVFIDIHTGIEKNGYYYCRSREGCDEQIIIIVVRQNKEED